MFAILHDRVMTVSFHKFGDLFFPGTGDVKVTFLNFLISLLVLDYSGNTRKYSILVDIWPSLLFFSLSISLGATNIPLLHLFYKKQSSIASFLSLAEDLFFCNFLFFYLHLWIWMFYFFSCLLLYAIFLLIGITSFLVWLISQRT